LHVGTKLLARLVAFLQESQCLADNFARCLVQAALNGYCQDLSEMDTVAGYGLEEVVETFGFVGKTEDVQEAGFRLTNRCSRA
jgi:hypothetical protein